MRTRSVIIHPFLLFQARESCWKEIFLYKLQVRNDLIRKMKQEIQTEWNSACRKKYTYGQISRTSKVRENLRYCKLTHKEGPVVMAV